MLRAQELTVGRIAQFAISKILSSTTHTPTGRLAMPKTRRVDVLSAPNTLTSNSDAASATFGCSRNSGAVTSETPRRTTRATLSSDPKCSLGERKSVQCRQASRPPSVFDAQVAADSPQETGESPPPRAASRSKRAGSLSAPLQHRHQAELAGAADLCRGPSAAARHWRLCSWTSPFSLDLSRGLLCCKVCYSSAITLPPAQMRAPVNMQHLAGDLARLGEIEHRLSDVLGGRNLPKG